MKVYVVVDDPDDEWKTETPQTLAVFADRAMAEAHAEALDKSPHKSYRVGFKVEEWDVLTEAPQRKRRYEIEVRVRGDTIERKWGAHTECWDYEMRESEHWPEDPGSPLDPAAGARGYGWTAEEAEQKARELASQYLPPLLAPAHYT